MSVTAKREANLARVTILDRVELRWYTVAEYIIDGLKKFAVVVVWNSRTRIMTRYTSRGRLGGLDFGALQRLHAAYRDGRLKAVKEAWMEIDADFDIGIDAEY